MDIPLLLEYHYEGFDEIWLVAIPENLQIERLMARNSFTEEEAKNEFLHKCHCQKRKNMQI